MKEGDIVYVAGSHSGFAEVVGPPFMRKLGAMGTTEECVPVLMLSGDIAGKVSAVSLSFVSEPEISERMRSLLKGNDRR